MTAPGQGDWTSWINLLRGLSPISSMGGSDELNRAYIAAQAQQNAALMNQVGQQMSQQQTNALRLQEMMGSSGGEKTDAAQRWRSELEAQQGIQNTRLRQEYAQLMGFGTDAQGNLTTNQTLGGRQQTLAEQQAAQQQAARMSEMLGYAVDANGNMTAQPTLAGRQLAQQATESAADRAARLQLQESQQGWQSGERTGTQQWQSGESAADRAARLALQESQQGWQTGEREDTQKWQAGESKQERDLRERLQSGQLNQQESEFARSYILQQQESRRKDAEMGGYMGNGQLTEAGRAARAGETTQRAALAAQLMSSPKDVFKAGAYFRTLNGSNPASMGLGGGGVAGFNTLGQRMSQGLPGTLSPEDVYAQMGANPNALPGGTVPQAQAPGAVAALAQGANAGAGGGVDTTGGSATGWSQAAAPQGASQGTGGTTMSAGGDLTVSPEQAAAEHAAAAASKAANPNAANEQPVQFQTEGPESLGQGPGGPVGNVVDAQLADLGIGAGGQFQGRAPAATSTAGGSIPYIDPAVFEEPRVKAMTRDLKRIGRADAAMGSAAPSSRRGPSGPVGAAERKAGATPSMVEVGPYRFGERSAADRRNSDERFLRGVALNQRLAAPLPGAQPGGPVDAPLFPTGGGTAQPQLQSAGSLGDTSSFQAPIAGPVSLQQAANSFQPQTSAIGSVDPYTQQYALSAAQSTVEGGVGGMGPQTLERMSKTQRGTFEGALEALGLSADDFNQAYAQTRFNNTGNVLSA